MPKNFALKDLLEETGERKFDEISFEQGLKVLEELVCSVESASLPLDKAVLSYERGVQLVAHLKKLLSGAEEKLKVLQKDSLKRAE